MRPFLFVVLATLVMSATAHAQPAFPAGEFLTDGGKGRVRVEPCGANLCAILVWVREEKPGETLRDGRNRNKALRTRPLRGIRVLDGLQPNGGKWDKGQGYDPERGMTFRADVTPQSNGSLKLRGCVGPICETQVWTKTP
jgi:uncharacterized protein (DUF2147 family)